MIAFSQAYGMVNKTLYIIREYHFCESEDGLRRREEIIAFLKNLANKWLRETLKQEVGRVTR